MLYVGAHSCASHMSNVLAHICASHMSNVLAHICASHIWVMCVLHTWKIHEG